MKRRRPALRLAIRIKQAQLIASNQRPLARLLNKALHDRDILDEVAAQATAGLAIGDGSLLQWFLENWETVLEIILTIIGLFSNKEARVSILKLFSFSDQEAIRRFWDLAEIGDLAS